MSPSASACPTCGSREVARLYLGTLRVDACECQACGARWEQDLSRSELRSPPSPPGRGAAAER